MLAALTELLHQVLQTRHAVAVLVLSALAEQPLQRAQQITFFDQIVAHGVEERLGVQVQDVLAAILRAIPKNVTHWNSFGWNSRMRWNSLLPAAPPASGLFGTV